MTIKMHEGADVSTQMLKAIYCLVKVTASYWVLHSVAKINPKDAYSFVHLVCRLQSLTNSNIQFRC